MTRQTYSLWQAVSEGGPLLGAQVVSQLEALGRLQRAAVADSVRYNSVVRDPALAEHVAGFDDHAVTTESVPAPPNR